MNLNPLEKQFSDSVSIMDAVCTRHGLTPLDTRGGNWPEIIELLA